MGSASLITGLAHAKEMLALYVQVDGVLTDAFEAKFIIYNESSGLPGAVLLSKTVTTGNGHFATGCYGAYDTSAFWAPAATYTRCRIEWRYKLLSTDTDHTLAVRRFEVVATSVADRAEQVPILVQDVKDQGEIGAASDRLLRDIILEWRDTAERYCRQRFRAVREPRRFRGSGGRILFLPEPLVGVATFRPNSETLDRDLAQFLFWATVGEERRNPKVEWGRTATDSIYYPHASGNFGSGLVNTLSGVWGFVDPETLECPYQIQRALRRGVLLTLSDDDIGGRSSVAGGPLSGEMTDGHEVKYAVSSGKSRGGMLSILKDPAIRDVLDQYRAPIAITTTSIDVTW